MTLMLAKFNELDKRLSPLQSEKYKSMLLELLICDSQPDVFDALSGVAYREACKVEDQGEKEDRKNG